MGVGPLQTSPTGYLHQCESTRDRLKTDLYKCKKVDRIGYKIQRSVIDIHQKEVDFQWYHRLLQTLISWPRTLSAHNQLITYMRDHCEESQAGIRFVEEYTKDYIAADAILWYTKPGCLFHLVNQAFRDENIDEIVKYRSFIKDLSEQLRLLHNEQREYGCDEYRLYRGTCLPYDDVGVLKSNQGKLISFNGFLSTSLDRNTALVFAQPSNQQEQVEAVLFEYYIDASLETAACPYIGHRSAIVNEQEFLFDVGAIFRIQSVKYDSEEKCWFVCCKLCDKKELKQLNFQGIASSTEGFLSVFNYGRLLTEMGQLKKAESFFKALFNAATDDGAKSLYLFGLANVYLITEELTLFHQAYQRALDYSFLLNATFGEMNRIANTFRKIGRACSNSRIF